MLKQPELDLPRGLSGAADLWDNSTAGRALRGDYFPAFELRRFGDETLYVDTLPASNGRASLKIHTLTEEGIVQSITVGFAAATTAGSSMRGIIYRVVGGVLTDLVCVGESTPIPAGGGMITSITPATTLAPGDYAIGAVTNGSNALHAHNTFGFGDGPDSVMSSSVGFASPAATWPGNDATYDYNVSAYATYAVGELPAGRSANVTVTLGAVTLSCTATIAQPGGGGTTGEFGDATGGGNTFPASGNRAVLSRFLVPVDCDLTKLRLRFAASSVSGASAKGLVYSDNAGVPQNRLGIGTAVAVPAGGGELDSPISVTGLVGGTYVWLGSVTSDFQPYWSTDNNPGQGLSRMEGTTYASPAATWTQSGTGLDRVNVVAEYSAGGATGIIGNVTIALGAVTLAATAKLDQRANASVTLDPVTIAATATLGPGPIGSNLSVTLGAVALESSARLALRAGGDNALGAVGLVSAARLGISAGGSNVLGAVSLDASARLSVAAGASVQLGPVLLDASARLAVTAGGANVLGDVGLSATALLGRSAQTSIQLGAVTLAATGQLTALGGRTGGLSVTLGAVGLSASARLQVKAGSTVALGPVSLASQASLQVRAGGNTTLGDVGLVSQARLLLGAVSNNELGAIAVVATAQLLQRAAAGITLGAVELNASAALTDGVKAGANITLGAIGFSATALVSGDGVVSIQSVKLLVPSAQRTLAVPKVERKFLVGVH